MYTEKALNSILITTVSKTAFWHYTNIDFYCDFREQEGVVSDIIFALDNGDTFIKVTGEAGVGNAAYVAITCRHW